MVALLTSVRNSPCFGGLRRTKTCHRQLFARPSVLFCYFLHDAKRIKPFPFGSSEVLQTSNQHTQNSNFPLTKLKPSQRGASRFSKPRISAHRQKLRISPIKSFAAPRPFRRPRRHYSRRQAAFETFPKSERFKAHIPPDRIPDSDIIHAPALCLRQANDREAIKSAQARLLSAFRPPQAHMSQP